LRDAARENVRWRTRRCSAPIRHGDFRLAVPNRSSAWNETTRIEDEGKRFSGHLRREA